MRSLISLLFSPLIEKWILVASSYCGLFFLFVFLVILFIYIIITSCIFFLSSGYAYTSLQSEVLLLVFSVGLVWWKLIILAIHEDSSFSFNQGRQFYWVQLYNFPVVVFQKCVTLSFSNFQYFCWNISSYSFELSLYFDLCIFTFHLLTVFLCYGYLVNLSIERRGFLF